jgi:hypothetical protein
MPSTPAHTPALVTAGTRVARTSAWAGTTSGSPRARASLRTRQDDRRGGSGDRDDAGCRTPGAAELHRCRRADRRRADRRGAPRRGVHVRVRAGSDRDVPSSARAAAPSASSSVRGHKVLRPSAQRGATPSGIGCVVEPRARSTRQACGHESPVGTPGLRRARRRRPRAPRRWPAAGRPGAGTRRDGASAGCPAARSPSARPALSPATGGRAASARAARTRPHRPAAAVRTALRWPRRPAAHRCPRPRGVVPRSSVGRPACSV